MISSYILWKGTGCNSTIMISAYTLKGYKMHTVLLVHKLWKGTGCNSTIMISAYTLKGYRMQQYYNEWLVHKLWKGTGCNSTNND